MLVHGLGHFALLSYKKRNWLENPILIYSLVLTFGYIVMSAITEVNFGEILNKPQYKDISDFAAQACSGTDGSCDITRIN